MICANAHDMRSARERNLYHFTFFRQKKHIVNEQGEFISFMRYVLCARSESMNGSKNELRELSIEFAIAVSDSCDTIKGAAVYVNQLIRSSSSIGANIHEARYAQSRADFISKMEIALKEASESEYWLELLRRKSKITDEQCKRLLNCCGIIQRKLIASITTAKSNRKNPK